LNNELRILWLKVEQKLARSQVECDKLKEKLKETVILSNQIECRRCGDRPYSAHRHDFRRCKCGSIAVDGGMIYLRRVGNLKDASELSIELDDATTKACQDGINEMLETDRNALSILCGIARTLRDCGYDIVPRGIRP
jgi:hypothetical protein